VTLTGAIRNAPASSLLPAAATAGIAAKKTLLGPISCPRDVLSIL